MAGRTYETTFLLGAKLASTFRTVTGGASAALEKMAKEAAKLEGKSKAAASFVALPKEAAAAKERLDSAAFAEKQLAVAMAGASKPTKEQTAQLKAAAAAIKTAEKELERAEKATEKTGKALREMGIDTAHLAAEQGKLAGAIAVTTRRTQALASATAAGKKLFGDKPLSERLFGDPKEGHVDKLGRQVGGILSAAAKLGAVGVGASVGLFALVKRAADAGDSIDDASGKLGIGGAALQSLRMQAKLAGASVEDADTAIGKLGVNIGKVLAARKKGGGGFGPVEGLTIFGQGGGDDASKSDPFKQLGLSVKKLKDMRPEQQLEALADAVAKLPNHSAKAAAVVATLGRGGLAMLPVLKKGGAALRKLREEGIRNGDFMSDEATKAASDFNDALEKLETRGINGVVNALGGTLLPVGTKTMSELTDWIGKNQDKIKAWAESTKVWIEGKAIPAVRDAAEWIRATGVAAIAAGERVSGIVGGFGNLATVVIVFKGLQVAATFAKITDNVGRFAGALLDAKNNQVALTKALAPGAPGAGGGAGTVGTVTSVAGGAAAGALSGVALGGDQETQVRAGLGGLFGAIIGGAVGALGGPAGVALGAALGGQIGGGGGALLLNWADRSRASDAELSPADRAAQDEKVVRLRQARTTSLEIIGRRAADAAKSQLADDPVGRKRLAALASVGASLTGVTPVAKTKGPPRGPTTNDAGDAITIEKGAFQFQFAIPPGTEVTAEMERAVERAADRALQKLDARLRDRKRTDFQ